MSLFYMRAKNEIRYIYRDQKLILPYKKSLIFLYNKIDIKGVNK